MSEGKTTEKKVAKPSPNASHLGKEFLSTRENGKSVKLGLRKKIEITEDLNYLKKGMIIEPLAEKADFYISKGIAKLVKED